MKEAVFCSNLLTELGFGKEFAQVQLYYDNTATLHALGNRSFSSRTKHIALRFFLIRELLYRKEGSLSVLSDRRQPCRHRNEAPPQAPLQTSARQNLLLQRQRLYREKISWHMLRISRGAILLTRPLFETKCCRLIKRSFHGGLPPYNMLSNIRVSTPLSHCRGGGH